ncbi:MFS transporter [Alicyclobacillus sp.]|uniref:MFS transporter n=1 Tax=Alicyclobacillus sp. TaxID=61169 RepID=UPI0025BDB8B5|nr:MFS transporter [Alicyclobacillus sp.]MCL6516668.1 MFS transporter [Alicyclobacillus sp.]
MAQTVAAPASMPGQPLKKAAVWTFSGAHLINDLMTVGLVPALLPLYKSAFHLTYTQTGLIVLFSYLMSSVMQPLFGWITDRKPRIWFLPVGVTLTCFGLALTGIAPSFGWVLVFIALSGLGSGIFHPEASRGTHLAAGRQKGLAQAIFQVGGNAGQAFGPLLVPLFLLATGVRGLTLFFLLGVLAFLLTWRLLPWYRERVEQERLAKRTAQGRNRAGWMMVFCVAIILRSWCQIGVAGFLPFFYVHQHMALGQAELLTFLFLAAGAIGTFFGGVLSDRVGRKRTLVASLALAIPFAWLLPHASGVWAAVVLFLFGFTILGSFAVSVVYAQMLLPRNIALASGLNIGFNVGAGGIGATLFGHISDVWGVGVVFTIIAVLPILSAALCATLPSDRRLRAEAASAGPKSS